MTRPLLIIVLVAAVLAPTAATGEVRSPQLTQALELASGRSGVDASCEPDVDAWDAEARAQGRTGDTTAAYTFITAGRTRFAPWICEQLERRQKFGWPLYVIGIEAARLAGERDEGEAGCWGLLWAAGLAWQVWGVPVVYVPGGTSARAAADYAATPLLTIMAQAVDFHRRLATPPYRAICA